MPKITIAEAARRLETTEEVIREWIRLGLLDVEPLPLERRRAKENILALHVSGIDLDFYVRGIDSEPRVDLEQLYEVAEQVGWFLLSMKAWDADEAET
jgi:hypothetical protein